MPNLSNEKLLNGCGRRVPIRVSRCSDTDSRRDNKFSQLCVYIHGVCDNISVIYGDNNRGKL